MVSFQEWFKLRQCLSIATYQWDTVPHCVTVTVLRRRNACPPRIEVWRQAHSISIHLQTPDCVQVNKASLSLRYSPEAGHGEHGKSKSEPWRWSVLKPEANVERVYIGMMWSNLRDRVTTRAAEFCKRWSLQMVHAGSPYMSALQQSSLLVTNACTKVSAAFYGRTLSTWAMFLSWV